MPRNGWDSLSGRHYDILNLLCYEGVSHTDRIAEVLGIRPNTVRVHVQTMLTRMHLHSKVALVAAFLVMERDKDRGVPSADSKEGSST